jgi:hypothetical protein
MAVVVVAAVLLAVWAQFFDPVRRWQRAVTDDENGTRREQAVRKLINGNAKVDKATALATLADALRSPSYRVRETHRLHPATCRSRRRCAAYLAGRLLRQLVIGQSAKFVVNQGQELFCGVGLALLDGGQNTCDLSHPAQCTTLEWARLSPYTDRSFQRRSHRQHIETYCGEHGPRA